MNTPPIIATTKLQPLMTFKTPLLSFEQHQLEPCRFDPFMHGEDFICVQLSKRCRVVGKIGGESFAGTVTKGELHLIGYETEIEGELQDSADLIFLSFNQDFLNRIKQDISQPATARFINHFQLHDPLIYSICQSLQKEFANERPSRFYTESLALALGAHLIRHYAENEVKELEDGTLSPQQLYTVREYVESHLEQDLSLEMLADLINFSPYYFARLFKQAMGTTPYAYIVQRRIEAAKRLLKTTNLPIEQVATAVGYSNPSHFSRTFKQHTEHSPRAFRRTLVEDAQRE